MDWLRWYTGTVSDPKLRVIARRAGVRVADVVAVWAAALENASDAGNRGGRRGSLRNFDPEDVAAALDMEPEEVSRILVAMQGKTLEGEAVRAWESRQPKREDSSAERMRALRDRKRSGSDAGVTHSDAGVREVTPEESREEESRERDADAAQARGGADWGAIDPVNGGGGPSQGAANPAAPAVDRSTYARRCCAALNQAQAANESVRHATAARGGVKEVWPSTNAPSGAYAEEWRADGIPIELAEEVISEKAARYNAGPTEPQIFSLLYLDRPVRAAWAARMEERAAGGGARASPKGGGRRGGKAPAPDVNVKYDTDHDFDFGQEEAAA